MISLEPPGPYSRTVLPARHARDSQTLIALKLNGQTLDLDHGYPCRLIAPTRPGVLQTKWLTRIEVVRSDRRSAALLMVGRASRSASTARCWCWSNPTRIIIRIAAWALIGVLLHDAVFAPVCVALGFAGRRILPRQVVDARAGGRVVQVVLVLLAIPVYDQARPATWTT